MTVASAQHHHNANPLARECLPHAIGTAHFFQVISDGTKFLDKQRTWMSSRNGPASLTSSSDLKSPILVSRWTKLSDTLGLCLLLGLSSGD